MAYARTAATLALAVKDGARARLNLSPASPIVRVRYAFNALMAARAPAEAVAEMERAREIDPASPYVLVHLAAVLVLRGGVDRAIDARSAHHGYREL